MSTPHDSRPVRPCIDRSFLLRFTKKAPGSHASRGIFPIASSAFLSLPSLIRTSKVLKKLDRYYGVFQNEKDSFQEASDSLEQMLAEEKPEKIRENAGEVLLQVCNILRLLEINGEEALTEALETLLKMYEIPE